MDYISLISPWIVEHPRLTHVFCYCEDSAVVIYMAFVCVLVTNISFGYTLVMGAAGLVVRLSSLEITFHSTVTELITFQPNSV